MTGVKEQKTEGKSQDTVRTPVPTSCNIHGLWRRNATPPNPRRLLSAPLLLESGERGLGERPLGVESGGDWDCEFWFGPVGWRRFFGSVMGLVRGLSLVFFTY